MIERLLLNRRAPTLGLRPICSTPADEPGAKSNNWVGAAISAAGSLLGGLIGNSGANSRNKQQIALQREQNDFNAKEAQKQRDWQEEYYRKYSSPIAQSAQYRAAGLNPYLANIQPQGVASGAQASSGEMAKLENSSAPLGTAIQNGAANAVDAYNQTRSVDSSISVNKSVESYNQAQTALTEAQKELTETSNAEAQQRVERLKQDVELMRSTMQFKISRELEELMLTKWSAYDMYWQYRTKTFEYFNILPEQQKVFQNQALNLAASAFKNMADGKWTLKQAENYAKVLAIRQYEAVSGRIGANASMLTAKNQKSLFAKMGEMYDSQTKLNNDQHRNNWLPVMHNGKRMPMKDALTYTLYNQNMSALTNSLKQPEMMDAMRSLWSSQEYNNYVSGTSNGATGLYGLLEDYNMINSAEEITGQKLNFRYDEHGNKVYTSGSETYGDRHSNTSQRRGRRRRGRRRR